MLNWLKPVERCPTAKQMHRSIPSLQGSSIMPESMTKPVAVEHLINGVDVFGDASEGEPTRVAVQVTACLSFEELLALLAYTPALCLSYEELNDDEHVRFAARFALLTTDPCALWHQTEHAMAVRGGNGRADECTYLVHLGRAITRVFGVSA